MEAALIILAAGLIIAGLMVLAVRLAWKAGGDERERKLIIEERNKTLARLQSAEVKSTQQSNEHEQQTFRRK